MAQRAGAAWKYRGFIQSSVLNEFRVRFSRSRFGALWMILQPLAQVGVMALVLSRVLGAKLPGVGGRYSYAIYLMAGILCWNLFSEVVMRCLTVFIDNAALLRKIQFPRITLPLIVGGSAILNNLALFLAVFILLVAFGAPLAWSMCWLPILMMITVALALGVGLLFGVLNVFMRDIGQVVPVVLQFLMWLTPIMYPVNIVPPGLVRFQEMSPLVLLVEAYHDVLLYGRAPEIGPLLYVAIIATLVLGIALVMFRRASSELVDVL
ncbi:ABC transporter permease [Solilutibacter silvestris]|uniref:Transport permease protein n=1 Tax=Solilutibacter silvestris TaxID=1645665 RepID=A0A2K1Q2E9_9GAMM|nr:ABC transporter permease [Lysobacter silvestris]PNS09204.1 ABC-type polysaccharide/polyol phosphate [Lysobacter silvestris]